MERKTRTLQQELKDDANLRRLAVVVRDSNDAITVQDFSGRILAWNRGAERMYGYTEKEALGMNALDLVPEDSREENRRMLASLEHGEPISSVEIRRLTKDGRVLDVWLTVWLTVMPLPEDEGRIGTFSTTERDITERKRKEQELIIANKELAFQNREKEKRAAELIIANKELVYQNEEKDKRAAEKEEMEATVEELRISEEELVSQLEELQQSRDALKESEAKFKRLYDSNVIGVIFWDTAGNIIQANGEFLRIVGYTEEDVLSGKARWKDMTPPEYADLDEKAIKEMTETGISAPFEKEYIRKDGSRVPIRLNAAFLKGEKDIGICFIQDITERKRAEEAIKRYAADLKRSNEELQQFAYVASHDLQEPLRAVASFTQLLSERYKGKLDKDADEFIAFAVGGANRMQTLINDLLSYSRLETRGKPPEPTDSHDALGQALANLGTAIRESGALVTNDDLPKVLADEGQLVQLFQNLIGNAVKFRGKEPPRVHVSAVSKGNEWLFSVRDNGIGIAKDYHERIFSIFQRLHSREEYPGTGIGLALCKRIVERQGGTIRVESEPGSGSTFFFTLPKP